MSPDITARNTHTISGIAHGRRSSPAAAASVTPRSPPPAAILALPPTRRLDKELVGEVRAAVQPAAPVHIVDEATVNDRGLGGLRGDMFGDEGAAEASAAADPEPAAVADVPPSEGPPPDSAAAEGSAATCSATRAPRRPRPPPILSLRRSPTSPRPRGHLPTLRRPRPTMSSRPVSPTSPSRRADGRSRRWGSAGWWIAAAAEPSVSPGRPAIGSTRAVNERGRGRPGSDGSSSSRRVRPCGRTAREADHMG